MNTELCNTCGRTEKSWGLLIFHPVAGERYSSPRTFKRMIKDKHELLFGCYIFQAIPFIDYNNSNGYHILNAINLKPRSYSFYVD